MTTSSTEQYERVCKPQFVELCRRTHELDESLRGNGKPGLNERVRNLERCETWRGKLFWMLIGAVISIITAIAMAAFTPIVNKVAGT